MPLFAFIGAVTISLLIYIVSYNQELSPFRFILVGIGLSGAAKSITTLLILNGPPVLVYESNIWLMGTIYGTNWDYVRILSIWFFIFGTLSLLASRELNIQNLDDVVVVELGSDKKMKRFTLLMLSTALASGAVAIGGGIGFVGLLSPHIARKLTDSSFENFLPLSMLIGGIIVVLADLVARRILSPLDLPVGIFTAVIGAPFFIYLLWQYNK